MHTRSGALTRSLLSNKLHKILIYNPEPMISLCFTYNLRQEKNNQTLILLILKEFQQKNLGLYDTGAYKSIILLGFGSIDGYCVHIDIEHNILFCSVLQTTNGDSYVLCFSG